MTNQSGVPTKYVRITDKRTPNPAPADQETAAIVPRHMRTSWHAKLPDWVMAGRPPHKGGWRVLWWLYARLGLYHFRWIPQPRPWGSYSRRITEMGEYIGRMRTLSMAVIAVLTAKGGATKTTTATWLSAVLMSVIKFQVLTWDTDKGGGKVVKRYGLDPNATLSGQEAANRIMTPGDSWNPTYPDLVAHTTADQATGVFVLHSPAGAVISAEFVQEATPKLRQGCHTLVFDTGPGLENSMTDGVVASSTVCVLVADGNSGEDIDDVEATLNHPPYGLRDDENLKHVAIAISGIRWRKYNTRTQFEYATLFGVKPEQIILIPYNRYLAQNKRGQTVRIEALNNKARFAWYWLADVTTRLAIAYNADREVPSLPGNPTFVGPTHPRALDAMSDVLLSPEGISS